MDEQALTTVRKLRALPWLYAFNAANLICCLLTIFGSAFPLLLNELGMTKKQIGLILSLPFFCNLISMFVSGWALRAGPRRVTLVTYAARPLTLGFLCLAPWLLWRSGPTLVFAWVTGCVLVFSILRTVMDAGFMPWYRDLVPDAQRGKAEAVNAIVSGVVAILVSFGASLTLQRVSGLSGYNLLIAAGAGAGVVALLMLLPIPGGHPLRREEGAIDAWAGLRLLFRDRNYVRYISATALYLLGVQMLTFLPLFLKEQAGLAADRVLLLDAVLRIGTLGSSYLWGWSADRFGSKPVLLSGMSLLALMPLGAFFLPGLGAGTLTGAIVLFIFYGVASQGTGAGQNRYFYVDLIPPNNKNPAYYSMASAWNGLFTALSPLMAGWLLDTCQPLQLQWSFVHVNAFTPLFVLCTALMVGAIYLFGRLRSVGRVRTMEFISYFVQGNPFEAVGSMIRYHFARDEGARVTLTEQMGEAKNPLSVEELLEALADPSFNVRYEAIVSIARMPPQARLTEALVEVLLSKEPDLSVAAGWALGRMGDRRAVPALRRMLQAEYALLRSRSARSLANLGDAESVPMLRAAFRNEKTDNIRVAYASALGVFRAHEALEDLLALLGRLGDERLRQEVALAVARMAGVEHHYVRLWRNFRSDAGTAGAETLLALGARLAELKVGLDVRAEAEACAQTLARQDLTGGAAQLGRLAPRLVERLGAVPAEETAGRVLTECATRLATHGGTRPEYLLLALTVLQALTVARQRLNELEHHREADTPQGETREGPLAREPH